MHFGSFEHGSLPRLQSRLIELKLDPFTFEVRLNNRCHFASFVMYSPDAKFEEHGFKISRDILD